MTIHVHQLPCLADNYGVLVHDSGTGATAAIDVPDAAPYLAALEANHWKLSDILLTHHHADHVQGVPALKARFPDARVVGPKKERAPIPGLDLEIAEGDIVKVGGIDVSVFDTPGHTAGHIAYYIESDDLLFAGDTLFALGCGRVFETSMAVMYHSLMKLAALPGETQVYCGHEYTLSNARFALTVDPDNNLLAERAAEVEEMRKQGKPTLPTTIALETATNPFLRAEDPDVQKAVGMEGADPVAVFTELRERKNKF
ncbi:MAG: hydroxyacylglutathione hydrolase [Methylobacteriaceae bacterium]|nr:hydroxyacylglutathione hydrolase [Methylobacteriaceae bacterium]